MQVGFASNFFAKALNDYSNWHWSFVREAMQNCMDSGASQIQFCIDTTEDSVVVAFENNGRPMDEDTIVNKLMNVGGTTKDGSGSEGDVGGFGVAKIVLYFAHDKYSISSGNWEVNGEGGEYTMAEVDNKFHGTQSIVTMKTDDPEELAEKIRGQLLRFAGFAQWNGQLTINYDGQSKHVACGLRKGYFRREFNFGRLYTNKSYNGLLIFRINGIPMFTKHIAYDGCAIFEANKSSIELMTSNRDGLKYQYQSEIEDVIQRFQTNRSSVLNRPPTKEIYGNTLVGVQLAPEAPKAQPQPELKDDDGDPLYVDVAARHGGGAPPARPQAPAAPAAPQDEFDNDEYEEEGLDQPDFQPPRTHVGFSQRFMLLNESGMTTPQYAKPGLFSSYCEKLLKAWTQLMREVHVINKRQANFAVGFCLGDAVAKHVQEDGITYYLINPFKIVEQDSSYSRSFKKRYNFTKDKEDLIMSAVHEFIHGLGYSWHNEDFANKQSTLAAVAMKHLPQLKRCFRA